MVIYCLYSDYETMTLETTVQRILKLTQTCTYSTMTPNHIWMLALKCMNAIALDYKILKESSPKK